MEAQKNTNELIGYHRSTADQNWSNFASLAKQAAENTASIQL
jgi:hypothetical protein